MGKIDPLLSHGLTLSDLEESPWKWSLLPLPGCSFSLIVWRTGLEPYSLSCPSKSSRLIFTFFLFFVVSSYWPSAVIATAHHGNCLVSRGYVGERRGLALGIFFGEFARRLLFDVDLIKLRLDQLTLGRRITVAGWCDWRHWRTTYNAVETGGGDRLEMEGASLPGESNSPRSSRFLKRIPKDLKEDGQWDEIDKTHQQKKLTRQTPATGLVQQEEG
jgi:hypothetical protein